MQSLIRLFPRFPFDVGSHIRLLPQAFRNVVTREGILSLWKGNFVTIIHRVPYSAANFGIYEFCNTQLHPHIENDVARRMTAGALSGLGACSVVGDIVWSDGQKKWGLMTGARLWMYVVSRLH